MHPAHTIDVDATQHHARTANHKSSNNSNAHATVAAVATATNSHQKNGVLGKEPINGDTAIPLATVSGAATADANDYQNGGRRDSTQLWTPLLQTANGGGTGSGGFGVGDGGGVVGGESSGKPSGELSDTTNGVGAGAGAGAGAGGPPSNNNEWQDAEEINNLKNGLLHYPHSHQGNNNGSLMNGKNGLGLPDKYDEQDPLTGLYKQKKHAGPSESDDSDFDSDLSGNAADRKTPTCGLFGCRPKWARNFASTHVFMVVFLLAYILQGMYMTYFVSVITTIEKLFQIKSKTTGFLLSASEMGQISTAMLLTYFAGRGHRPRWIACGMVLFSIAAFACSLPHFIFGKQLMQSTALLNSRGGGGGAQQMMRSSNGLNANAESELGDDLAAPLLDDANSLAAAFGPIDYNLCLAGNNSTDSSTECNEDRKMEQASHSKITVIVLCIFFASLLSSGIGQTAVATLGIPYIDDNVASKQSPMYMAITIGVRILGPASGFIVGSFCTRWYVNFTNPAFDASDPRWIGAWWLGPVVIGSLMMLSSIAMFSFPKQLRGKRPTNSNANGDGTDPNALAEPEEKPKLKDFPKTVRRQLSNDILMFRTASCVFHLLPIAGLYTFLPKYLETQFRLATYDANMIAAFCGILVMGVGIVISGMVILKLKPSARSVAAWIAFTALVYSAGMVVLMFVGCSMSDFAGYKEGTANTPAHIELACSAAVNCNCDKENFAPICGVDGKIYISSCHGGCAASDLRTSDNRTIYSSCACIPDVSNITGEPYEAVNGYCDSNCKNFILFILIFAVCVFMHSTSEVGSMLLVMRCTHPKDKAMAMGVIQSAIGLFGNVPCPIIYGAVVDSACVIWKTVCGKHGACSLYDADTFRHYFLGITAGIMFLAFIMDLVVWSKAHRIDIAPEDNNDANTNAAVAECKKSMAAPDTSV